MADTRKVDISKSVERWKKVVEAAKVAGKEVEESKKQA